MAAQEPQIVQWDWNVWCMVGTEGAVYKNGREKIHVMKDLVCLAEGDGIQFGNYIKYLETFWQQVTWVFSVGRAWGLGEKPSGYYNSPVVRQAQRKAMGQED